MSELRRDAITGRWVIIAPERRLSRDAFRRPSPVGAMDGDLCPFCEGQEALAGREILAWRDAGTTHDGRAGRCAWCPTASRRCASKRSSATPRVGSVRSLDGLGAHEVIVETPDHRATLATMTSEQVERVLWAWRERVRDLRRDFRFAQHPGLQESRRAGRRNARALALAAHGDAARARTTLDDELDGARRHFDGEGACVFCDLVAQEIADGPARHPRSNADCGARAVCARACRSRPGWCRASHARALRGRAAPRHARVAAAAEVLLRIDRALSAGVHAALHSAPVEASTRLPP